jgi:hypothetical protein
MRGRDLEAGLTGGHGRASKGKPGLQPGSASEWEPGASERRATSGDACVRGDRGEREMEAHVGVSQRGKPVSGATPACGQAGAGAQEWAGPEPPA